MASVRRRARRWSSRPRWMWSASPAPPRSVAGSSRPRARAWPRSASSWAARTRSSSATMPISSWRRTGGPLRLQQRRPALRRGKPDHRVRLRSTTASGSCCSSGSPGSGSDCGDDDDFGPVINEQQLDGDARGREAATQRWRHGAHRREAAHRTGLRRRLLHGAHPARRRGGGRSGSPAPSCSARSHASTACRTSRPPSRSPTTRRIGLTASIHTANIHRAMVFTTRIRSGVAVVNGAHLRQRAAPAVRRSRGLRQRLARSRHRGARRVFRLEDGLHQLRPRRRLSSSTRR